VNPRLREIVGALEKRWGAGKGPGLRDPLELVLWESVAYLVNDERRLEAFTSLKKKIGLDAKKILAASDEAILEAIERGGGFADQRLAKVRQTALLVVEEFGGDLRSVLKLPRREAKKALAKFPGIGEPGAEKILLFTRTAPVLALESNGLRALVRLGFGEEKKSYSTMYRSAQAAVGDTSDESCDWLAKAHELLRRHGQETCTRNDPACRECVVREGCRFAMSMMR
jgi:endonuclease III